MRFSIIIPAYNAEGYLQRCLESIFCQTFTNYEVICIDDGSTDGTATILKQYPQIKVISQTNQGMASARNRGMEIAQGDYILFVDSDDRLCPNALATLAPQLNGKDIIGFGTRIFNESTGTYTDNPIPPTTTMPGWDYFNCHRLESTPVHFVCIWQRTYRRAFLEEKGLRFVDGLRRAEDDLFTTMAMLHAGSVKTIADCLYIYHLRATSITRSDNPALRDDARRAQQLLAETFISLQGIDKSVIYQVLASNYINFLEQGTGTCHNIVTGASPQSLSPNEWEQFREVCVTPRHRRLYNISHISPTLLQLYNKLCSLLR